MKRRWRARWALFVRFARRRSVPAVALGVVALSVLGFIVVASATGEARTPGVFEGGQRLVADSFRAPNALDPEGDFRWTAVAGSWSLSGTALVADEVPARLASGRELPRNYSLGVSWEGDAEGARVDLRWTDNEAWSFRVTGQGYEFVHVVDGATSVISAGDLPESDAAGPTVRMTRTPSSISVELTGSNIEDRRRVASVDNLKAPTDNAFSLGSDRAGVRFARLELELPA